MGTRTKDPKGMKKKEAAQVEVIDFSAVVTVLSREPGVTFLEGKGFGSKALRVNGKIFAMVSSKDLFVVKLPGERVAELVEAGEGEHFDAGKGKPMKEWLAMSGQQSLWVMLAKEALQFVGGAT